jgi:serine/threonine protein kinase
VHLPRRLPAHHNIARVFGTFSATMPTPQQDQILARREAQPDLLKKRTLCVVMEHYSFTFDEIRQSRIRRLSTISSSSSPLSSVSSSWSSLGIGQLFNEGEILHVALSLANGLLHLHTHGFAHR